MAGEVHQALYAQTQAIHQEKVRRYVRAIFRQAWEWFLLPLRQVMRHYDVVLEMGVVSSSENLIHFALSS